MKGKNKNTEKRKQLLCMFVIAFVSSGIMAFGRMLVWMKLISILLVIMFLYGLIRKKRHVILLCTMVFILCNLVILGKYNGKWFWQNSNTINAKTGIYGSQITYKYGDWADVILPEFVGTKVVYIDENSIYKNFFKCYSMEIRFIDCNMVLQIELGSYLHMGPVYFQGYSYLFSEGEMALMDEMYESMGYYPQIYFEHAEMNEETEVFCITDSSNNIYILSKEEYERIMKL